MPSPLFLVGEHAAAELGMTSMSDSIIRSMAEAIEAVAHEPPPDTIIVPEGPVAEAMREAAGVETGAPVRAHLANEAGAAVLVIEEPVRISRPPRPSDYGSPSLNWPALVFALVFSAALAAAVAWGALL